jgi:hypothetical protein
LLIWNSLESELCLIPAIPFRHAPGGELRSPDPGFAGVAPQLCCGQTHAGGAPGAEREKFSPLNLSRDMCEIQRSAAFTCSAPEYSGIVTFTLLVYNNPVSTRARRRASLARPRLCRGSAAFGGAPGAEREKYSLLNLSRDMCKIQK